MVATDVYPLMIEVTVPKLDEVSVELGIVELVYGADDDELYDTILEYPVE